MKTPLLPLALAASLFACTDASKPADTEVPDTAADTDEPVDASWVFTPVDGMVCGDGSPTGVGVSAGSDPSQLVVFVAGGGACWDALTCFVLASASHLESGWGEAQLRAEAAGLDATGLLDRDDPENTARAATYVYVPYCTGDLHVGRATRFHDPFNPTRATHHQGDANVRAVLAALKAAQPDVEQLWVVGQSAGGYGVQLQADRWRTTWPDAALRVFADGAPLVQPYGGRWGEMTAAWDPRLLGEGTLADQRAAQRAALPDVPFALTTHRDDLVITLYFNYPAGTLAGAQAPLLDGYTADALDAAFVLDGPDHTMLGAPDAWVSPDGLSARAWFTGWRDGGAWPEQR